MILITQMTQYRMLNKELERVQTKRSLLTDIICWRFPREIVENREINVKVKVTPQHAMQEERGGRGIAIHIFNHGAR